MMDEHITLKRLMAYVHSRSRDVIVGIGLVAPWVSKKSCIEWGINFHQGPEMTMDEIVDEVEKALAYRDSFGTKAENSTRVSVMTPDGKIVPVTEKYLSKMMSTARRVRFSSSCTCTDEDKVHGFVA